MRSFDLTPLYRASVGFDRLADVMDRALSADVAAPTYPPIISKRPARIPIASRSPWPDLPRMIWMSRSATAP